MQYVETIMSESKSPGWMRFAQIGLGIIAVILSITILVYPRGSVVTIVYLAGVVLLIVGIEKVITGFFVRSGSRMGSIGLGILVIILSLIVMAFPHGTTVFLVVMLGVALLVYGIARIIHGIGDRETSGWARWSNIGVGVPNANYLWSDIGFTGLWNRLYSFLDRHSALNCWNTDNRRLAFQGGRCGSYQVVIVVFRIGEILNRSYTPVQKRSNHNIER